MVIPLKYGVVGRCDGAEKLSVPGRPTDFDNSRARAYCVYSRGGLRLFVHLFSCQVFISFSLSMEDEAI